VEVNLVQFGIPNALSRFCSKVLGIQWSGSENYRDLQALVVVRIRDAKLRFNEL